MHRDVKVGLVLGVLLVAIVAVVFFRRDEEDRDKFAKLVPSPEQVASKARDVLGPSASDPYPVPPEFLADAWQRRDETRDKPNRRKRKLETSADSDSVPESTDTAPAIVLEEPEFGPAKPSRSTADLTLARISREPSANKTEPANEYVIQEGDTLSDIASRKLGHASLYPLLYEANRDVLPDPEHIPVGQRIRLPNLPVDKRSESSAVAAPISAETATGRDRVYEVQEGDSLIHIARRVYGKDSMYRQIFDANRDQLSEPNDVRVGMVLRLP